MKDEVRMPRSYITKRYINRVREMLAHGLIDFGTDSPAINERFFQFLELMDKIQADHHSRYNEPFYNDYRAIWTELSAIPKDYAEQFVKILAEGCPDCGSHRGVCAFNTLYLIFSSIANKKITEGGDELRCAANSLRAR